MAKSGVNVKMGVSGVAQFKTAMKGAQASVKTLDEALKLNEKQFKATGDSEKYMQEKSKLLQEKLEEQRKVVEQAQKALDTMTKNGVDRASASFQQMQQALYRAQGNMLDTETALDNLGKAAQGAEGDAGSLDSSLRDINKNVSFQNVTEALGTITDGMQKAARKAWELGTRIVDATLGAGSWADELQTTATQWEITPEQLQRMRKTAGLIDTDAETILSAMAKMKKTIAGGGEGIAEALQEMGLSNFVSTDPEEEFWAIGEAIMHMGDAYDKENAAQKMFGRSWRELLPLFQAGREEYEKTNASWSVVSDEQLKALGKMDDQYQKLQGEWETFKNEMLAAFAGPMTEGMETLTGLVKEFNQYLSTPKGQEMIESIGSAVSGLISDLTKVESDKVLEGAKGVFDQITGGLKWIADNKNGVVKTVEGFIGAWAALKTAQGVTTALQLFNGIRGLSGGAASGAAAASAGATAGTGWATAFAAAAKAVPAFAGILLLFENALKEQGNDDLWDENGNPTEMGKSVGITEKKEEYDSGRAQMPNNLSKEALTLQNYEPKEYRTGLDKMLETAGHDQERIDSHIDMRTITELYKLPTEIEQAIVEGMARMNFYMDGEQLSVAVTPHIEKNMADAWLRLTK